MNKEEKNEFLRDIERDIINELNDSFSYEVMNSIIDYDAEQIIIEVNQEIDEDIKDEVEESVYFAMPFNCDKSVTIDGYRITAQLSEELDEWQQSMLLESYETEEEQYYSIEQSHLNSIDGSIQSLDALYTTQPFAQEIQSTECLQAFYLNKKMERLEELKEAFERFKQIVEEEEEQSMK